ncbi:hypothetical protein DPMN_099102, partial [Dreissena polymorpha]
MDLPSWIYYSTLIVSALGQPSKPSISANPSIVPEGQTVTLSCISSDGNPVLHAWRRNGEEVTAGTPTNTSKTLVITNVSRADANSSFTCTSTDQNNQTSEKSAEYNIFVAYGPDSRVSFYPQNDYYVLNENTKLDDIACIATCNPSCTFEWKNSAQAGVTEKSVLSIGVVDRRGAGNFTCTATNPVTKVRSSSSHITIHVRYGPDKALLNASKELAVTEGQRVSITCSVDCWSTCPVKWSSSTTSNLENNKGDLVIENVNRTMSGLYTCSAYNNATGRTVQNSTQIFVHYPPAVTMTLTPANPIEGQPLDVVCNASGIPAKYVFTMTHTLGGVNIPNSHIRNDKTPTSAPEKRIHIPRAVLQDMGTYMCYVHNRISDQKGNLHKSAALEVRVSVKPSLLSETRSFVTSTGKNVTIKLPIYSLPSVNAAWFETPRGLNLSHPTANYFIEILHEPVVATFYGTIVDMSASVLTLIIYSVQEEDYGDYKVWLRNAVNVTQYTITLTKETSASSLSLAAVLGGCLGGLVVLVVICVVVKCMCCKRREPEPEPDDNEPQRDQTIEPRHIQIVGSLDPNDDLAQTREKRPVHS